MIVYLYVVVLSCLFSTLSVSSFICHAGWPTLCLVNLENCLYFSMAELKILSFNVQGLGGIKKQKDVCKIKVLTFYACKIPILQKIKKYIYGKNGMETVISVRLFNLTIEEWQY